MPEINILDDNTINRIAAGEVVERPVNIVKELVENSIDAGASSISIEIKGGGIDLIRVTDNGCGIDKENIPKAFLRHATSKINDADDLMFIDSLGFRGEALASVAAVSRVEMMTKTKDAVLGNRFVIHGGKIMSFDEAGVPDGTTVIVRDLFYNTPARRKFLKSATTEGNYITELVEKLILSHPDIMFKYTSGGSLKLSGGGQKDIPADIYTIFGKDVMQNLVEVSESIGDIGITGFVGKPAIARGNKNQEIFFVNKRYVKSKILSKACEEAYKPYLMLHRFPFVILYIDIPQEYVDVNVHPSKTEIRFRDEQAVYRYVHETVTEGLTRRELIPQIKREDVQSHAKEKVMTGEDREFTGQTTGMHLEEMDIPRPENVTQVSDTTSNKNTSSILAKDDVPEPFDTISMSAYMESLKDRQEKEMKAVEEETCDTLFKEGLLGEKSRADHRIIGQVFNTYWIVEYDGKMYVIDQHAAHEKVLYERICAQVSSGGVISQLISPPYIVSLSPSQADAVEENLELFEEMGFTVNHFGGREYALSSVPNELFWLGAQEYFLSIVDDLVENNRIKEPGEIKDQIATMACKAAVKGNMRMSEAEARALIDELLLLDNPYNCPHGRPTIISFSKTELEKMFKRIV